MMQIILYVMMLLFFPNLAQAEATSTSESGNSLSFDFTQYVTIPNCDSLNPGNITAECWVKFRTLNGHAQFFICKGGAEQGAYNLYLMDGSIFVFELDGYTDHRVDCPPVTLSAEKWYHVAGVYDGNTIRVVLNGKTIGEKEIGYVRIGTAQPLFFNHHLDYPWFFSGDLDEVRIWSIARTDGEIASTKDMEVSSAPGLVAAWHLNEGSGQVIHDLSGGHDGYLGANTDVDSNDPMWKISDIQYGSFAVLSPIGGEIWQSGTMHDIVWRAKDMQTLRIEYSIDGGAHWIVAADSVDARAGSWQWKIPMVNSEKCLVRLKDNALSEEVVSSPQVFIIAPSYIKVLTPKSGDTVTAGYKYSISWISLGVDRVRIECSPDNGATWESIVSDTPAIQGQYTWRTPWKESNHYLIRITDTANSSVSGVCEGPFSVRRGHPYALAFNPYYFATVSNSNDLDPQQITIEFWIRFHDLPDGIQYLVEKGGGDTGAYALYLRDSKVLVFELSGFAGFRAESDTLSLKPETWYHIAAAYDGDIRVVLDGNTVGERHIGPVHIGTANPLHFSTDQSGPRLQSGDMDEIRLWSVARTDEEIKSSMFHEINNAPGLVGAWHLNEGTGYTFLDSAGDHDGTFENLNWVESDIQFSDFAVLSPAGGEIWQPGTIHDILWREKDLSALRMEYSVDGGANWMKIADNVNAASGVYSWRAPDVESTQCLVRLTDSGANGVSAVNPKPFTISKPYVRLLSPDGDQQWETGTVQEIAWSCFPADSIRIEYSSDNGIAWKPVAMGGAVLDGRYSWAIPYDVSAQCLVRISSVKNPALAVTSNTVFSITRSTVQLLAPRGGESFESGSNFEIKWTASPGVSKVNIEFSSDAGANWKLIGANLQANAGTLQVQVPERISPNCLVRVSSAAYSDISDQTPGSFSIAPSSESPSSWKSFSPEDAVRGIALQGNYVWCATANGPVRWDIRDFSSKVFDGPPDNRLNTIVAAPDGSIWMGSPAGLTRFDGKSWTSFTTGNNLPYGNVTLIAPGSGDALWVGMLKITEGYMGTIREWWVAEQADLTWATRLHEDNFLKGGFGPLTDLAVKSNSDVWAIRAGRLLHFDGISWKDSLNGEGMTQLPLTFVALGDEDDLWVTGGGQISYRHEGKWTTHDFGDGIITALTRRSDGVVGVGISRQGVDKLREISIYDGISWSPEILGKGDNCTINALSIDNEGVLWAGTPSGLFRVENSTRTLLTLENVLPDSTARLVGVDPNGDAILASTNGFLKYDGISSRKWTSPYGLPAGSSMVKEMVFSTNGPIRLKTASSSYDYNGTSWNLLPGGSIATRASDGTVWASNLHSLSVAHIDGKDSTTYVLMPKNPGDSYQIESIVAGTDGGVWAVVAGSEAPHNYTGYLYAIFEFDGSAWENVCSLPGYYTSSTTGLDNSIWLSGAPRRDSYSGVYSGGGVYRFRDGQLTVYNKDNGLLDNSVSTVMTGPDGTVWVQTETGLSRFGGIIPTGVKSTETIPHELAIKGNYPNPFNPSTTIFFTIPASGKVDITIYDITGRKIRHLLTGVVTAGTGTVIWDGRDGSGRLASTGVYFARLTMGRYAVSKKMLLVK